ncbi:hypothetical protein AVEN_62987-1 [Araneus ventricosus]|uniref:Uncharacterized protein n=1 Tax=Araneus ventricosus TaxID=182803 RepID=A0A4Y2CQL3_ARAVE|nr:hypothetical protein AVEN_62987-1 [Araneus ventricosus]
MRRTTPEPAPPSPNFRATPVEGRLTYNIRFKAHPTHMQEGSLAESDFETGTLQPKAETTPLGHCDYQTLTWKKGAFRGTQANETELNSQIAILVCSKFVADLHCKSASFLQICHNKCASVKQACSKLTQASKSP